LSFASQYLPYLKTMDLGNSKNLIKMPNFGEVPNLEKLNLEGCVNLVQIDPSIGLLRKLVFLNLKNCKNLISIPNSIFGLTSLKYLNLSRCSKVFNNPGVPRHLNKLDSSEIVLHSQSTTSSLYRNAHKGLVSRLLSSLLSFSFLWELDISFCGLSQMPDAIGCIPLLGRLNLIGNNFVTLPSFRELSNLVYLELQHCKQLKFLPELPLPHSSPSIIKWDEYWKKWGLYIFNCPELGERDQYSSMTLSWLIQFVQANQESLACFRGTIDIVIPASEIPRWLNNQCVGKSIRIDLSPILHDSNFIGLACCVVFSVTFDDPTMTTKKLGPGMSLYFYCHTAKLQFMCPVIFYGDLITLESNHTWLIYVPRDSLSHRNKAFKDVDHITMTTCLEDGEGLHVDVNTCGYRYVFKQDLEQFNSAVMHHRNPYAQKRKFLAIED